MDDIPRCITLFVLILLRSLLAAAETAYTNCNRIRLKTLAEEEDNRFAVKATAVLDDFDSTLSALLIGLNVLSITASALATVLFIEWLSSEATGSFVSTIVMTVIVFLIGEMIPKNIANANSDSLAMFFAYPTWFLTKLLFPFVFLFRKFSDRLRAGLSKGKKEPTMTEDEFQTVVESAVDDGVLEKSETRIIRSAINFGDKKVREVMRKREDIVAIDQKTSPEKLKEQLIDLKYSRIPIYDGSLDNIVGILRAKQLLEGLLEGRKTLQDVALLTPLRTRPDTKLDTLFEEMGRRRIHIAIVSENRKTIGLVTMEDLLEEIVGEIYDEDENIDPKVIEKQIEEEEKSDTEISQPLLSDRKEDNESWTF